MQQLIDSYTKSKNLHHAYFLVGDKDQILKNILSFLDDTVGFQTSGNPDFWMGSYDNLSIDEARAIAESSENKDFGGGRKIFIIQTDFISQEAQNSLLKVFEEPTDGTHFFIISPQDILIPTLRSRMQTVQFESFKVEKSQSILGLNMKDRLAKVKQITDGINDEEKTKQDAISLLNNVEKELHETGVEKSAKAMKLCQETRASLYDRGAPIKIILENLLLNV